MEASIPEQTRTTVRTERGEQLARLEHLIEHAGHLLPAQGPITVFVHHNTLHAFEDLPFDDAVKQGGRLFGCEPYLPEDRYRQKLARGRIRVADLQAVLRRDLRDGTDERIANLTTRGELRLAMLQFPLPLGPTAELRWFVAETDALSRFRAEVPGAARERMIEETKHWVMRDLRADGEGATHRGRGHQGRRMPEAVAGLLKHFGESSLERWSDAHWEAFCLQALWRICRDGVHGLKTSSPPAPASRRHRDLLLEATGDDTDLLVHDVLIRFCAAFLDQGFSHWPLPVRDQGFYRAFCSLYGQAAAPPDRWLRDLPQELRRLADAQLSPLESVLESLQRLGVSESEWEPFITATLLALRGWAGMIRQMELRADRAIHPAPDGSLLEFLAVRLILERAALASVARSALGFREPLSELRRVARRHLPRHEPATVDQRAFVIFQLAQLLGWLPAELLRLSKQDWAALVEELELFSGLQRRRMFQLAFERRYRTQALDALTVRARRSNERHPGPRFQVICCIDEREESFRRHLEELSPDTETFGAAGFFSVAMYYRGAADAHYVPLCPIVIRPQHWVVEDVVYTLDEAHRRRAKTRRALGTASHTFHVGSRTLAGGALLAAGLGALATFPLVARVLFPRLAARIRKTASRFVQPPSMTRLQLERTESLPGPEAGHVGFTVDEMTNMAERLLRDIGLTSHFARLVVVIGHGSNSVNNPHKSAYDCGACGGGAGGPNARALAEILNDPRVRERLRQRDLQVPPETIFLGAFHNTCNDSVTYFDLERLPKSHQEDFEELQGVLEQGCDANAHERCRRFQSAPLTLTYAAARRHVEARSEDLAQTRPECGHATNALCIVGRRQRTRGLYLDRRAFLVSYDPTQDNEEHAILTRILQAVVPVCSGINLEYYFSYVDPAGWGCGTKLPHNVTSLLGIMDGAASDLRPGLPWQMVEIHEPVRLLFVIESTPEAMLRIMDRNEGIGRLCRNGWIQLATLDPHSAAIHRFDDGRFVPYEPENTQVPTVPTSVDWYRGWRDHLGFTLIES